MKKSLFKVLSLILVSCLLLLSVGCGNDSKSTETNKKIDAVDLKGREIKIISWGSTFVIDEKSNDEYMQDCFARQQEMEEAYNCKFVYNFMDAGEILPAFTTAAMTGESIGDIVVMKTNMATTAKNNDLLLELGQFFDVSKDAFYKPSSDILKDADGGIYSIGVDRINAVENMIYFNKEHFNEVGIDIPQLYKWVADGEWTVDKFKEIIKKSAIIKNGSTEVYSIYGSKAGDQLPLWLSMFGAEVVHLDENKKATSGLKDANMNAALEFIREVNTGGYAYKPSNDDAWDFPNELFYNGISAMLVSGLANREAIKSSVDFEFGVLPMPKSEYIEDYPYTKNQLNVAVMPKTFEKDMTTAKAIADMITYIYTPENKETEDSLKKSIAVSLCDEESVDIVYKAAISDKFKLENYFTIGLSEKYNSVVGAALNPTLHGTATIASAIGSVESAWQATIDEYNSGIK